MPKDAEWVRGKGAGFSCGWSGFKSRSPGFFPNFFSTIVVNSKRGVPSRFVLGLFVRTFVFITPCWCCFHARSNKPCEFGLYLDM